MHSKARQGCPTLSVCGRNIHPQWILFEEYTRGCYVLFVSSKITSGCTLNPPPCSCNGCAAEELEKLICFPILHPFMETAQPTLLSPQVESCSWSSTDIAPRTAASDPANDKAPGLALHQNQTQLTGVGKGFRETLLSHHHLNIVVFCNIHTYSSLLPSP